MKLVFSRHAWDDYLHWQKTDRRMVRRINVLIENILRSPSRESGSRNRSRTNWPAAGLAASTASTGSSTESKASPSKPSRPGITTDGSLNAVFAHTIL